ncbi:aspartate kinase [Campylobacter sp. RM12637]|uniref:aspartate kinase n=1 Tax=Campylobacter sp. RM12637 TaxID=2735734 RepID=UPI003015092B|nr:aspartate kinase [Campylobacter sp. RM12637]
MLVVQKYGGTSVGNLERIENVANRVIKSKKTYKDIVVVVSAMSGRTNQLIDNANFYSESPNKKELDMLLSCGERETAALLAIALISKGHDAISLSGKEAGLLTTDDYTNAKIIDIDATRIKKELSSGKIIVVAGFQGYNEDGHTTTLGRGGSDLSAVAFAGALNADLCEIYTDVDGVYTTDPRIEPKAKKLDKISYEEMLELASLGAKVLQNRSVELAKKLNVKLVTRSSFNENSGTIITSEEKMEQALVSGIALDKNQSRIVLRRIEDKPGIAASIFTTLAKKDINVDMIIQNVGHDGTTNLGFTVPQNELKNASEAMRELLGSDVVIESDSDIVKVSVVGVGMKTHSGVASAAFEALANEGINIQMISTSEIKISMIVSSKYAELAVRTLHKVYKLED